MLVSSEKNNQNKTINLTSTSLTSNKGKNGLFDTPSSISISNKMDSKTKFDLDNSLDENEYKSSLSLQLTSDNSSNKQCIQQKIVINIFIKYKNLLK